MRNKKGKWNYPRTRLQWLWDNMEGYRLLYGIAILGTVVYNIMQLTVPYFSGQIIDKFLTGEGAHEYLQGHMDEFVSFLYSWSL